MACAFMQKIRNVRDDMNYGGQRIVPIKQLFTEGFLKLLLLVMETILLFDKVIKPF
jgi:hypothetical protein